MKRSAATPKAQGRLTRRGFMHTSAAAGVGSQLMMVPTASHAAGLSLEGYASATSVAPGGTLDFFLRDPQAVGGGTTAYPITFTRIGAPDTYMSSTTVAVGAQVVPADAYSNGCRWVRNHRLTVPTTWPSGLYFAYLGSGENACTIPFVVRAASPTAGVKTLVMIPVTTVQAYNAYGGKSIYDYNSSGGVRTPKVSLDRPLTEAFNAFFDAWSQHLVRWMDKNNLAADFCTDLDIEASPDILKPYQLLLMAGHDEYWSSARRKTVDAYVAAGGNCAYLGGNTAWFQARLESNGAGVANRTLVCYKDAAADPNPNPALKTVTYISLATPQPENTMCGLGYVTGCSWTSGLPRPDTPSVVMRAEHWAFAGTGLAQGAGFGGAYVGYESNSASFSLGSDRRAYPTGTDGTPATLRILAQADASNWNALSLAAGGPGEQSGYAHIAVFSRGGAAGTVFNAGSNDWCYGLIPEINDEPPTPISRITQNVIDRLSKPWIESADVRQFSRAVSGPLFSTYFSIGNTAPAGSNLVLDGLAFRAYAVATAGTTPVYRFRSLTPGATGTRYCYSRNVVVDIGLGQWVLDGLAFHAHAAARADNQPIYQHSYLNAALQERSFYLSASATPPSGWSAGPVVFYAPTDGMAPASAGFSLSPPATNPLSLVAGKTVTSAMVKVNPIGSFNESVTFSVSGAPAGVSVVLQPASSKGGTKLVITAAAAAAPGSYTLTITGSSAARANVPAATASTTLTLQVLTLATRTFSLEASPAPLTVTRGQVITSPMIQVVPGPGFNESVYFCASGLPLGTLGLFSPIQSKGGSKLTLVTTPFTPPGTYTITVNGRTLGSAGMPAVAASTTVQLVVKR